MNLTLRMDLPGLRAGSTSEGKETRKRRKRFKRAMKDLEVDQARHLVPILEGLLAANAAQLDQDLHVTTGDWFDPELRVKLIRDHANRATVIAAELEPLLEELYREGRE